MLTKSYKDPFHERFNDGQSIITGVFSSAKISLIQESGFLATDTAFSFNPVHEA
jgi:hypothetical protein